jgi:hypothetical protein
MKNNTFISIIYKFRNIFVSIILFFSFQGTFAQDVSEKPIKDMVISPANYTATKVTLSKDASIQVKEEFVKNHGADFFYVYTDPNGKTISKEDFEIVLRREEEKNRKSESISNPKK